MSALDAFDRFSNYCFQQAKVLRSDAYFGKLMAEARQQILQLEKATKELQAKNEELWRNAQAGEG